MKKKVAYILLTQGKVAIVSHEDWAMLSQHKWFAEKNKRRDGTVRTYYAATHINGKNMYMHRFLMKPGDGLYVDHRDGDGLNNTRDNLRIVTPSENQQNNHGKDGVLWGKIQKRWLVCIRKNGKSVVRMQFRDKKIALRAYARYVKEIHGEFAFIPREASRLPPITEAEILYHRYTSNKKSSNTLRYVGIYNDRKSYGSKLSRGPRSLTQQIYLGSYSNKIWAARAYDYLSRIIFKEKARLNFPKERYSWKEIWKHSNGYKKRPNYRPNIRA